jgi:transcriptional regulator with XRE-family HTH domain
MRLDVLAPAEAQRRQKQRRELARFLRAKRESLRPEDTGLARVGRRRTPGLRREEVAMLAGIGVAWYTRLESARDVSPSLATLDAVAKALRLNNVEVDYLFTLASVPMPGLFISGDVRIPEAIEQLVPSINSLGAVVFDRYSTALRWNAIADSMFDIASAADILQRNALVRYLSADVVARKYFGDDYDSLVRSLVGMFRRAFLTTEATPFAHQVFDFVNNYALFRKLWDEQLVAEDVFEVGSGSYERFHPVVGSIKIEVSNLRLPQYENAILRIIAPTDAASAEKFTRLHQLGTASTRDTPLP